MKKLKKKSNVLITGFELWALNTPFPPLILPPKMVNSILSQISFSYLVIEYAIAHIKTIILHLFKHSYKMLSFFYVPKK